MSLFASIKRGSEYMELWPDEIALMATFPEPRAKYFMKVAKMVIPPGVAFLIFWMFYTCGGFEGLYLLFAHPSSGSMNLYLAVSSLCIVTVVLLIIPLQAYMWFYYRSNQKLTKRQRIFYEDLMMKLQSPSVQNPTLYDFIKAINDALKTLDNKDFLDHI